MISAAGERLNRAWPVFLDDAWANQQMSETFPVGNKAELGLERCWDF
jgi:hypothetical protein